MPSRADLAKIHIAKKELAITDDAYRDILRERFGKESAAKLTPGQAWQLINHFKALGWKPKRSKKHSTTSPKYKDPQRRKVVAIWITMAKAGTIRNRSNSALQKYVKKMTGKDDLRWCDGSDLNLLIEGLKQWAAREDVELG